jgi:pyruvate, water dikinase
MSADAHLTVGFGDIGIEDRPIVGGKGASLGELTRAGIRAPQGFVVTTAAFERFIAGIDPEGSIRAAIEGLSNDDLLTISKVTEGVRARIVASPMPADIERAIVAGYAELCAGAGEPVAVRSSATAEDGSEASFAGLQETYLWIKGPAAVLHAVRDCWASLFSVESVSYRLRLKLPEEGLAMGVVVQRMVASRASGVMFTRSPLTGDRSVIVIESSWGLGSAVVSGVVTPDKYVVSKVTGEILKRNVSNKTVEHVPDFAAGGVREVRVGDDRREAPCLSDDDIAELVRTGKRVETHYGCPQDIEWAFAPDIGGGESLFLLQSRPETIWANKDAKPAAAPKAAAFAHVFDLFGGARKT